MSPRPVAEDAFGDPFDLDSLPLPRAAAGYAVQLLDTDRLLDRHSGNFLPVRSAHLAASFATFGEAHAAASQWLDRHGEDPDEHRLSIVPVGYDPTRQRHVLIYGVLCGQP
jgi:hypothetical protein